VTLVFMGILCATLAEMISVKAGLLLLPPQVLAGVLNVAYWYSTEAPGRGDLRAYLPHSVRLATNHAGCPLSTRGSNAEV
jgi:hypothetical protein